MDIGLTRRNVGRLVLLAWAVALAWLARREFAPERATTLAERTRRLEPGAQYFAVLAGGRQIGQYNRSVDTLVDGVRITELLVVDLPEADSTRQLARATEYQLSRGLRLQRFSRTGFGVGLPDRLEGGLGTDSLLTLQHAEGNEKVGAPVRGRVESDAVLPAMIPYRAAFGGHLRVGTSFEVPLLDLGTGAVRPLPVRVTAESTFVVADSTIWDSAAARWVPATFDTVRAWRLEHDAPGAPTISWVDAGGALLGEATAGGISLVRSAFEIVSTNYGRERRAESSAWRRTIPGMVGLATTGIIPDTTMGVRRFLLPSEAARLRILSGGRQATRSDTLVVWRETPGPGSGSEQGMGRPAWDLAGFDDPLIQRTAARAGGEWGGPAVSAGERARNLTRWVGSRIGTDHSLSGFGTALNTLRAQRGTADGKARLLATLARASGIPARVVTGVAIVPQGEFAHAWVELWLGRWVAADPTFGQFPASASLVRVAIGGRSRPTELLPLVASARFLPLGSGR